MDSCVRVAAAALAVIAIGAAPAMAAGPPQDYTQTANLSQPVFSEEEVVREVFEVPMHDGIHMYVEVVRPAADGNYPVILEASPYHGTLADRDGTRILPEPRDEDGAPIGLTGYFAPRGYAVVMADLRGTGRSEGCLDHLGQNDAKDLKDIVEWAAQQPWSNGRVGMTGHSYVGSTPSVAAAQDPEGLVTILPSAGLSSMYDHQFQAGVPYFLQWVGTMEAYEQLASSATCRPLLPTRSGWWAPPATPSARAWSTSAAACPTRQWSRVSASSPANTAAGTPSATGTSRPPQPTSRSSSGTA